MRTAFLIVTATLVSSCSWADSNDSAWWAKLSPPEQFAFYAGAMDCYIFDVHGKEFSDKSLMSNVQAISAYYTSHPDNAGMSVLDVMREVARRDMPSRVPPERHSYFDGEYWRQFDNQRRIAFVEGYLACRSKYLQSTTSTPVAMIVPRISKWYGVSDEDVSEIDDRRSSDKIGDLLDRMLSGKFPQ